MILSNFDADNSGAILTAIWLYRDCLLLVDRNILEFERYNIKLHKRYYAGNNNGRYLMINEKVHEECGVFGFFDNDGYDVAKLAYYGLYALQHRGQESCGIAVNDDSVIHLHKDNGLVNEVFTPEILAGLKGTIAVGHVRYSAANGISRENAQPLVSRYRKGSLTIALNGNIINADALRDELERSGALFQSTNSTEVILHVAAHARANTSTIQEALRQVMDRLQGAYSMIVMSPRKLIAVRDPNGFRPLVIGKLRNSYAIASESAGLDVIGAQFVRDVEPGEIVTIDKSGITSIKHPDVKPSLCVFEYVYFARPDSVIDGVSVYQTRLEAGRQLARNCPADADLVIGVPDSGLNFAMGFSEISGIPYGEGLIKNRYTGRTFIKPSQAERDMAVSIKLNVLRSNVAGKRIVMIDDSIVRGTTCANIIRALKEAGATEVHMRVASPPFLWPCFFGTDIPNRRDLIAVKYTQEQIREKIGAESLGYLPIESLDSMGLRKDFEYCKACFTGNYPINVDKELGGE